MAANWFKWEGEDLILKVQAKPRASRDEFAGVTGDALKIRITAPPVDGKANAHLIEFLAQHFGVAKSRISLLHGHTTHTKWFRIVAPAKFPSSLQSYLGVKDPSR